MIIWKKDLNKIKDEKKYMNILTKRNLLYLSSSLKYKMNNSFSFSLLTVLL